MALDQDINYRVRIDDGDFQAKLSQMRASIDSTMGMGRMGGMGGMGGMSMYQMGGFMGAMAMGGSAGAGLGGGVADFGASIMPITYTPPAIAMQPHFGMFQVQQSLGQAIRGMVQPFNIFDPSARVPQNITAAEYTAYSAKQVADSVQNMGLAATMTAASIGMGALGTSAGTYAGAAIGGGAIGGFVGGTLGGMLLPMATTALVAQNVTENIGIQNALSAGSFRFLTGGPDLDPLTGRGFSREARRDVASTIQRMSLEDPRYYTREMSQVLESGMQQDMFSGTRDVEDFKSKFKNLVETMKTITTTLHTSIGEGMAVMRGMRDMGIDTPAGQMAFATKADVYGRMAGRTPMEMMAFAQTGAEMFRGTGVRMELGAEYMMQNAAVIRNMLSTGSLSRETVAQAGGEQGLNQQMLANALASTQTAFGRGFLMANYAGGGSAAQAGIPSIEGMTGRLEGMTPAQILSFEVDQRKIVGGMSPGELQAFSMRTTASGARTLMSSFGMDFERAYMSFGERVEHKSHEALEAELALAKQDPTKLRDDARRQIVEAARTKALQQQNDRMQFFKIMGGRLYGATVQPISERLLGKFGGIATSIEDAFRSSQDYMMGAGYTARANVTSQDIEAGERLLKDPNQERISYDITSSSILGEGRTSEFGEKILRRGEDVSKQLTEEERRSGASRKLQYNDAAALEFDSEKQADDYLKKHQGFKASVGKDGKTLITTTEEYNKMRQGVVDRSVTQSDTDAARKILQERKGDARLTAITGAGAEQKEKMTVDELASKMFGKGTKFTDLRGTRAALLREIIETHEGFTTAKKDIEALDVDPNVEIMGRTAYSKKINEGREQIKEILGKYGEEESSVRSIARGAMNVLSGGLGVGDVIVGEGGDAPVFKKLTEKQVSAISAFATAKSEGERQAAISDMDLALRDEKGLSARVQKIFSKDMKEADKKKLLSTIESVQKSSAELERASGVKYDEKTGTFTGPVGSLQREQMEDLEKMSKGILQNMETLIAIHKEWVASKGRPGGH